MPDEHDQLGGGVVAVDVGARVGFGVSEPLRVGQHRRPSARRVAAMRLRM